MASRDNGTSGYLGMLAVDPSQQRFGVGRALLVAAENHCRERGCTEMTLSTGSVRHELLPYYEAAPSEESKHGVLSAYH